MFKKPTIELEVYELPKELKERYWKLFKKHHYLGESLNKAARCWVAYLWGNPVAFNSVLAMPSGSLKNAWREHRLVVLSDYQGMGIGNRMSECVGKILKSEGKRFFSKTANIKLGEYRNNSSLWRGTSKNGKARPDNLGRKKNYNNMVKESLSLRVCYSHEYTGESKAFVFDFDDTLATTNAKVIVVMPDTKTCRGYIKELSPSEFNDYELKNGERFDFSQFRCSERVEDGKPTGLMQLARDVYEENHDVYILTARGSDVSHAIQKFLKLQGVEAKQVICVGDGDEHQSISLCKAKSLTHLKSFYDKLYFYDDNEQNIELAKEVGVKSYLV